MEDVVASNLTKHLNNHNILYDLQHGFRERRSCETQLIQLVDEFVRNLSSGHQTDRVLLDFSKAFDKVSHTKLLYKLQQHETTHLISAGIRPLYSGCGTGKNRPKSRSHRGFPQGLVLRPILFLLYINDLLENIHSEVRLFADVTAVYLTIISKADCQSLQQDLHKTWGKDWEMEFNPSKFCILPWHVPQLGTSIFCMAKFLRQ